MSYKNPEIWQLAREVAPEVHEMSLKELPKFEIYETGQQIRRSAKSTRTNIVEGYGRRKYQKEYYKFLIYSLGSNDETSMNFRMLKYTNKHIKIHREIHRIQIELTILMR